MPTETDLCGLGMSPFLAQTLGNQPSNVTCTGTAQTTAAAMLTKNVVLNAQSSQTGAIIPSTAKVGSPHYFANGTLSGASAVVYVPVGHSLNGVASQSVGVTIAANHAGILIQLSPRVWYTIPLAP